MKPFRLPDPLTLLRVQYMHACVKYKGVEIETAQT